MTRLTLTLPEDLIRQAKAKAALEGTSVSKVIRAFLKAWTATPSDVTEARPEYWDWVKEKPE